MLKFTYKKNILSFIFFSLFFANLLKHPSAHAATVLAVDQDRSTLTVKLSREELKQIPWRGSLLVEAGDTQDIFVAPFDIVELNPAKSSVILKSRAPIPDARRLMAIRFLPVFWDTLNYPWLISNSQLHTFKDLTVGAGAGSLFEASSQRRADRERRRLTRAAVFRTDLALPLPEYFVGFNLSTEYFSATQDISLSTLPSGEKSGIQDLSTQKVKFARNSIKPGLWTSIREDIRLGLEVNYSILEMVSSESSSRFRFMHELLEPGAGLTYHDPNFEGTLYLKMGDASTSKATSPQGSQLSESESKVRTPSEGWILARSTNAQLGLWGAGIGYIFYRPVTVIDNALMPSVRIGELLRGKLSFEKRLSQGHKVNVILQYDGARTPGPLVGEKLANTLSLTGGYQKSLWETWTLGTLIRMNFGTGEYDVKVENSVGKLVSLKDKASTLGSEISFYLQKPIGLN